MDIDWDALTPAQQQGILNGPAGKPPEGVETRLGHPQKENVMTLVVLGISLVMIAIVVFIRVYARVCMKRFKMEDGLGLLALAGIIGHAWSIIAMAQFPGLFVHVWDVHVYDLKPTMLTMNKLRTFYSLFQLFSKDAILLEWIHVFVPRTTRTTFFWLCWGVIAINTMLYISFIFTTHLRCIPQEKMWFPWVEGNCIDMQATDVTIMVFNLVCDVIILLLPQSTIWKLQLQRRQKLGLSFLFSLGLLTVGCAAGRIHATVVLDYGFDWLYDMSVILIWGVGESTFVMMVFCIPAAPQAFRAKDVGLGSKLVRSLPWSSPTSRLRSRSAKGSTSNSNSNQLRHHHHAPGGGGGGNFYRKMDDGGSQVALTELGGGVDGDGLYHHHLHHVGAKDNPGIQTGPGGVGSGRIVKTTKLVTSEDRRTDEDAGIWDPHQREQQGIGMGMGKPRRDQQQRRWGY